MTFPEPTKGIWPADFTSAKKSDIRALIAKYVDDGERDLLATTLQTANVDAAVNHIIANPAFPVPKGRNTAVVKQVLKAIIADRKKSAKEKKKRADAKEGAAGKRKRDEEPEDDDDDDDEMEFGDGGEASGRQRKRRVGFAGRYDKAAAAAGDEMEE